MTVPGVQKPRPRGLPAPRTVFALILREMSTTYGRSAMGYLWALLEPVAALALLSAVFALVMRQPALGTSFPLFFASGYLVFLIYLSVGNKVANAVLFSKALLEFPAVTPLDTILARFILNFLTQLLVIYVVLAGIITVYGLRLNLQLSGILQALGMAGVFALGIGTFNCYFMVAFPSYASVWSIVNRPMFILSGTLFLFDDVPQPFRDILWYNPLIHMIGKMRAGIYATYDASYVSVPYVMGLGCLLFAAGLLIMQRNLRNALDR